MYTNGSFRFLEFFQYFHGQVDNAVFWEIYEFPWNNDTAPYLSMNNVIIEHYEYFTEINILGWVKISDWFNFP